MSKTSRWRCGREDGQKTKRTSSALLADILTVEEAFDRSWNVCWLSCACHIIGFTWLSRPCRDFFRPTKLTTLFEQTMQWRSTGAPLRMRTAQTCNSFRITDQLVSNTLFFAQRLVVFITNQYVALRWQFLILFWSFSQLITNGFAKIQVSLLINKVCCCFLKIIFYWIERFVWVEKLTIFNNLFSRWHSKFCIYFFCRSIRVC